ncbi:hypothetical protein FH581_020400 [Leptospira weilii]|nr:hypothetical protein [Leptospira weilii]ULH28750.1 hypothetical protein FH586_02005 [Leptospira weilii]ULH29992.1 hypothetical protein FH586_09150 [Leptospira weilii]UPY79542.1 hypothetical protein FH581_012095 [Leptospira weilii]UPY80274.1 hypothetical protein FH581_019940 [Leptospira weilii]UPY80452.1 hypothetical protein FH581_020400 [Leptospira weilii]
MAAVVITLIRFIFSFLLIYLYSEYALGLDTYFTFAFIFCLMNEIAFSMISSILLAGTEIHFLVPGSHSDTIVKIIEKELEKPYTSWSEIDPYLLINAIMKLNESGRIPKSTFHLTPLEIAQILKLIDEISEKRL